MAKWEKMTIEEHYKLVGNVKAKYLQAGRKEKGQILNMLVEATGLERKYLITLLNGQGPYRKKRKQQRGRKYGAKVDDAIRIIGSTLDWICAERLTPGLVEMALHLARHGEMIVDDTTTITHQSLDASTIPHVHP